MPDVMVIKEIQQDALTVLLSGLGGGSLQDGEAGGKHVLSLED